MRVYLLVFLFVSIFINLSAQEKIPFKDQVAAIVKRNDSLWNPNKKTTIFTGSSSIRFWKDLQERFPENQILNSGFGGSQATDLLYHLEVLVLKYQPQRVFIYEGDNDIFLKKRPKHIISTFKEIIQQLQKIGNVQEIYLLAAKPSISRWKLRGKYKRLNKKLGKLATNTQGVGFIDLWYPMLNGKKVKEDIFIADGLHMNNKGYAIWYNIIKPYMK